MADGVAPNLNEDKGKDAVLEMKEYEKMFDSIVKDNERQRRQRTFRCQSMVISQQEIEVINKKIDRTLEKDLRMQVIETMKTKKSPNQNEMKFEVETQIKNLIKKREELMEEVHKIDDELEGLKTTLELLDLPTKEKKKKKKEKMAMKKEGIEYEQKLSTQKENQKIKKNHFSISSSSENDITTSRLKKEKKQFESERAVVINERDRLGKKLDILEGQLKTKQVEFEKSLKEASDRCGEQGKKKEEKKKRIEEKKRKIDERLVEIENEITERQKLLEERLRVFQQKQERRERKDKKSVDMKDVVN